MSDSQRFKTSVNCEVNSFVNAGKLSAWSPLSVSRETLDSAQRSLEEAGAIIVRFLIVDNKLYLVGEKKGGTRADALIDMLNMLLSRVQLPDLEFLYNFRDEPFVHRSGALKQYPVISAYSTDDHLDLLAPHPCHIWLQSTAAKIQPHTTEHKYSWSSKKNIVFWRGGDTGATYSDGLWRGALRPTLIQLSQNNPTLVDAKFVKCDGCDEEARLALGPFASRVSHADHLGYRYLLIVDGNSAPSSRYAAFLFMNSALIKQDSPIKEYFYDDLVPNKHYFPVKADLSDLVSLSVDLQRQGGLGEQVAQASTSYAQEHFRLDCMLAFWSELLEDYAKLLDFAPTIPPGATHFHPLKPLASVACF